MHVAFSAAPYRTARESQFASATLVRGQSRATIETSAAPPRIDRTPVELL
jgi:hypothetical protein